jgi:uncharacterized protein YggE
MIVGLSLGVVFGALPVTGVAQTDSTRHRVAEIHTAASAERHVRPDLAIFTISFSARARTPLEAGRMVAARVDTLRTALARIGIPRDSLVSGSSWYWWSGRVEVDVSAPHPVRGPVDAHGNATSVDVRDTNYVVSDQVTAHIRDLRLVGPAIDTALAHRIIAISPVQFRASDVAATREVVLREATERAHSEAIAMAEASGGRLGRTLLLTTEDEGGYSRYPYEVSLDEVTVSGGASPGTEVIAPSVSVSVTVFGRWEFIGGP